MYCPLKKDEKIPPCMIVNVKKWGYLKDFLIGKDKGEETLSVVNKIGCISYDGSTIKIDPNACIGCLFCLVNCPENLLSVDNSLSLKERCSDFNKEKDCLISRKLLEDLLNKGFIKIESKGGSSVFQSAKYKSFEAFASVDETQNIAIWALSLIQYLSGDSSPRMGREISMVITDRDRGGRLDVCLLSFGKTLICIETKVNFDKMMQENRYVSQMIAYRQEISKTIRDLHSDLKSYAFILVDGDETKLLFPNHPECSSKVGNQATIFYRNIEDHKIFFISAQAVIGLVLKKLFLNKEKYSIESVLSKIVSNGNLGLLSMGIISKAGNDYKIIPIDEVI